MGRISTLEVKESILELKKLQKQQQTVKAEKRILCLLFLKTNKFTTQTLLAESLAISRQSLVRWLSLYRKAGIQGILLEPSRNKPSKIITPEIHQGLSEKVQEATSPLLGYLDAQRWVEEKYGVKVKYHWLRVYMIKHFKTKLKVPRKSHIKKDEKAITTFLKPS